MRVEREAAQKQQEPAKCKHGGAMVGDTIIFSSHNPMNEDLPYYVLTNKPYVVRGLDSFRDGTIVGHFLDEEGNCCTVDVGSYDIIIKAEQKPVESSFRSVHLVLESQEELASLKHTLRCSSMSFANQVYYALDKL